MPSSFLSPLTAPAHTASSTAQASDLLARQSHGQAQSQGQDFGQALARSVSNAQHNSRREQAALDAKSTEARRVETSRMDKQRADAHRTQAGRTQQAEPINGPKKTANLERASKQDKTHQAEDGESKEELQSKDPSSAALGVLDWLGGQVKAQALGRGGDDTSTPTSDPLAIGIDHASAAHAAPVDEAQASHSAAAAHGAKSLGGAGSDEAGLGAAPQATFKTEATQDANAQAKPGEAAASGAGSAAVPQPEAQAGFNREGPQGLVNGEGVQSIHGLHGVNGPNGIDGMEALQGSSMASGAPASAPSGDARPAAALRLEAKDAKRAAGAPVVRSGPRATPGAMAQAGLAPLPQPAVGKAAASFASSIAASASSSASAKAEGFGSAGQGSITSGTESRPALASKAAVASNSSSTGDAFASLALDTTTNAPAANDTLATPATAQAAGQWGQLEPEVGTPAWQQALSQQVMQMRRGNANEAELQLNPLGLGPLRIKLSLREQELNAEFSAAHAQVREALEAALPQLREALQLGGIQLGQAVIDAGAQSGQSGQNGSSLAGSGFAGSGAPGQDSQSSASIRPNVPPQTLRNPAADALAAQGPRQSPSANPYGPGQRLNTFA